MDAGPGRGLFGSYAGEKRCCEECKVLDRLGLLEQISRKLLYGRMEEIENMVGEEEMGATPGRRSVEKVVAENGV